MKNANTEATNYFHEKNIQVRTNPDQNSRKKMYSTHVISVSQRIYFHTSKNCSRGQFNNLSHCLLPIHARSGFHETRRHSSIIKLDTESAGSSTYRSGRRN